MKLVGMRIEDDLASRLDKLASDKNRFYSKNEAYQKILEIGIKHFEGEKKENITELLKAIASTSIENRQILRQVYRGQFDVKLSDFETPDDEIKAVRMSAKNVVNEILYNKDSKQNNGENNV
ncbi:hypothetical protein [Cysteiniphilum litorale]|uniref:hypothetical protein n=1 Tax=Cysteiniphilum litorale TaxID=2056700 RepID=UPI003F885936